MSMLTPPGMGGRYRITGDKFPRLRRPRRRRRVVFLSCASAAAVGLLAWGTLQLIDVFTGGGSRATAASGAPCSTRPSPSPTPTKAYPEPRGITVNVLNATKRSGLAKTTADELKKRGFHIGQVGNATAEYDKKVKGAGLLLGAPASLDTAMPVLGTQLAGTEQRADTRTKPEVDLIIGDGFKELSAKPAADKALARLRTPKPAPSSSKGC
jgi:hypothetical protein